MHFTNENTTNEDISNILLHVRVSINSYFQQNLLKDMTLSKLRFGLITFQVGTGHLESTAQ